MKQILKINVLILVLFHLMSCQKDDKPDFSDEVFDHFGKMDIQTVSASEIPHVMEFLKRKNQNSLKFPINRLGQFDGINRNNEPDLILTELQTSNVKAITDDTGKTNYTFILNIENPPQYEDFYSFFNLIVKEVNT